MKLSKIALVSSLTVMIFAAGCVGHAPNAESGEFKDFTLKSTTGESVNFKTLVSSKKAVLLNFWATWCPPCREEIPGLISLQQKYGGNDFTILGVDIGESQAKVAGFMKKMGMNYPVVLDTDQAVGERYQVVGIPTSYLYNSKGEMIGEYHSYSDELVRDIEKAVKADA